MLRSIELEHFNGCETRPGQLAFIVFITYNNLNFHPHIQLDSNEEYHTIVNILQSVF